jgi:hypothetical protein
VHPLKESEMHPSPDTTVSGSDARRQDEQPDSFHRALSTTSAVQSLDAAGVVASCESEPDAIAWAEQAAAEQAEQMQRKAEDDEHALDPDDEPEFSTGLPPGAVIEGYCIDPSDGLRYPYGSAADGTFWIADEFAWTGWLTREARDQVLARYRRPDGVPATDGSQR